MKLSVGERIVWVNDPSDPTKIQTGRITRISKDLVFVDNKHRPEDCIFIAYCWPHSYKTDLLKVLTYRKVLKKQFDDSIKLLHELRNRATAETQANTEEKDKPA